MQYPEGIRRILPALFYAHYTGDSLMIAACIDTIRALWPIFGMGERLKENR